MSILDGGLCVMHEPHIQIVSRTKARYALLTSGSLSSGLSTSDAPSRYA